MMLQDASEVLTMRRLAKGFDIRQNGQQYTITFNDDMIFKGNKVHQSFRSLPKEVSDELY